MQILNPAVNMRLDTAQRAELVQFVRHAPPTALGLWLKQMLPENGGLGHIPSHQDEVHASLIAVMAASINALNERVEELEAR